MSAYPPSSLEGSADADTPREDERLALLSMLRGYRQCQAVFAAHELGLFEALGEGPATLDTIAVTTSAAIEPLSHLIAALCAMNLLHSCAGIFELNPDYRLYLSPSSPDYMGPTIAAASKENAYWTTTAASVFRGEPAAVPFHGEWLDEGTASQNIRNVGASNAATVSAVWNWIKRDIGDVTNILDIGAGNAAYSLSLLDQIEGARAALFDIPEAIAALRPMLRDHPAAARIVFEAGDARTLNHDAQFNLVFLNDLLIYFPQAEKLEIVKRAARSLLPGGLLVMTKLALNSDRTRPRLGALFSLNMRVTSQSGYLETDEEAVALCEEARLHVSPPIKLLEDRTLIRARL